MWCPTILEKMSNKKSAATSSITTLCFFIPHFVVLSTFLDANIILLLVIPLLKTPQRKVYKKKAVKTVLYTSHLTVIFRIIRHLSTFLLSPLISKYFLTFFRPSNYLTFSKSSSEPSYREPATGGFSCIL